MLPMYMASLCVCVGTMVQKIYMLLLGWNHIVELAEGLIYGDGNLIYTYFPLKRKLISISAFRSVPH